MGREKGGRTGPKRGTTGAGKGFKMSSKEVKKGFKKGPRRGREGAEKGSIKLDENKFFRVFAEDCSGSKDVQKGICEKWPGTALEGLQPGL